MIRSIHEWDFTGTKQDSRDVWKYRLKSRTSSHLYLVERVNETSQGETQ
jgi:hypothetical protein